MTDLRKAAEMALEALELERTDTNGNKVDLVIPAIKALRTALAQPEQEPVAFEDWLKNQHGDPEEIGFLQALRVAYYAGADSHPAPPSKPWVSLSDRDITGAAHTEARYPVSILETTDSGLCMQFSETGEWHASDKRGDFMKVNGFLMSFARAIEAALRSKNDCLG